MSSITVSSLASRSIVCAALIAGSSAASAQIPAIQGSNANATAVANEDEAAALSALSASAGGTGATLGGWIRARYANSSDVDTDPIAAGSQDLGGFSIDSMRLIFSGQAPGNWAYYMSVEGGHQGLLDTGNSGLTVMDACATVPLGDNCQVVVGRFGANFLWSANIEERNLVFLDRNYATEDTDNRDQGFEFQGWIGSFNWWAAMQNGADGAGDKLALSGRASWRVIGDAALCLQEGCCLPTGAETQLVVGAACFDDANFGDGTAIAGDVWFAHAPWTAYAEVVNFGDDIRPVPGIDALTGTLIPVVNGPTGSKTTASLTVAYMLSPARWEVAARAQDLDDGANTTIYSAAVNRYIAGHNAKWTVQFDTSHSDVAALEADTLAFGLTVGF
jgi:hypothetical protein